MHGCGMREMCGDGYKEGGRDWSLEAIDHDVFNTSLHLNSLGGIERNTEAH